MGRLFLVFAATAGLLAAVGAAHAADADKPEKPSVFFSQLTLRIPQGETYLFVETGLNCSRSREVRSKGGASDLTRAMRTRVNRTLEDYGFNTKSPTSTGFGGGQTQVFELKGEIRKMVVHLCWGRMGTVSRSNAEIAWELYSRRERAVVARITTEAFHRETYDVRDHRDDDEGIEADQLLGVDDVVADNIRDLLGHPNLKKAIASAAPRAEDFRPAADLVRITARAGAQGSRTVAQAAAAVVTITTSDGHGSGVLVSADGHILTNQHVVGNEKTVTVRWADMTEAKGEVMRVHTARDVALVKVAEAKPAPLSVRAEPAELGEAVMAIGSPLDQNLSGTVTRGIVSTSTRVFEGFPFIQSDVAVSPGNSGGALIDDKGRLIGLTDLAYDRAEAGNSLNLFIPIKDALAFTGLDLAAPPEPAPAASRPPPRPSPARRR